MSEQYTEPLVFGLDIGTRSIVGTVGYKKNKEFVVVAQVVQEHETRAMLDGQIHDINKVAETIREVKKQLEDSIGQPLKAVCIAAAGRVLATKEVKVEQEFENETVITNEHIYALEMLGVEKAYELLRKEKQEEDVSFYCVGYSVVRYYLNDYAITNLESHKANIISAEVLATFLPDEVVDGLYAAVEKAGLYVANLTLEPIAAINVAIPEKYRLLNIALVDVGAGTSDISITKDGSIIAYGMIPSAGDEFTEILAKHYLTDFKTAEQIKRDTCEQDIITYEDIMGLPMEVLKEEVLEVLEASIDTTTKSIADQIIALNGGTPVNAVFVVGGGGKVPGFVNHLANHLGIQETRVALRGREVMGEITFLQEEIQKDALLVTPVGICLNFYEQRNNFIFVQVNKERVKLYDNSKLTVMDAAMTLGFPNEDLFPKRGKALEYYVNDEKRLARGQAGEAAEVSLNGKEAALRAPIEQNDVITIRTSTVGEDAKVLVEQLPEYKGTIEFVVDGKSVTCPKFARVNGNLVPGSYEIQNEDKVQILDYYTLEQVLEFMDVTYHENICVNHEKADLDTKVYKNFSVQCDFNEDLTGILTSTDEELMNEDRIDESIQGAEIAVENEEKSTQEPKVEQKDDREKKGEAIEIQVNKDSVILHGKEKYILVDVLDFYPFDLTVAKGNRLITTVNGVEADFTASVKQGDAIRIYWGD